MSELVLVTHEGPVTTLALNRGQRHNSLTPDFLEEILAAIHAVPNSARAVVLRANGRSFSTGGDIMGFYQHLHDLPQYGEHIVGLLNQVILAIMDLQAPLILPVHGIITGGSMGFVLAADIVIVAPEASFTPFYSVVGFSPDGGWSAWLASIIGKQRTADILMCNRTISAKETVSWGLAARLLSGDQIQEEARQIGTTIASTKRGSILNSKKLLAANREYISSLLEKEKQHFVQQIDTEEARQGIIDFIKQYRRKE